MPDQLKLSTLFVGPKDLMVMRSLLNLAGGRGGEQSWQISERPGGDVSLVDVDNDQGETTWKELTRQGHAVIALSRRKDFQARFLLHKPLRSREFLKMLTRLASGDIDEDEEFDDVVPSQVPTGHASDTWRALPMARDSKELPLAEHLRRQTWKSPVVLTYSGWPLLLIDPGSGAWFYDGSISDLNPPMFAEYMPASAGVPVSSSDLVERVQGHRQRPLSELKWYAGLAQMRGYLHPDLIGDVQFMLTQVPAEAMQNQQLHRLAQTLIRGPTDIDTLREESGQPPENVMAFLNACYTSGKLLVNRVAQVVSF